MKNMYIYLCLLLISAPALAETAAKGDPHIGKTLFDKSCTSCHISKYGGDGSKIFTRPDHAVKNSAQLSKQVRACNANTGASWFPDEETHVATYLNMTYYHFK